jgi:hypothetical protein
MSTAVGDSAFALAAFVKVAMIAAGVVCVFMGFRLFTQGITRGGAKIGMSGEAGGWKAAVAMDRGGPGLIFALFGLIISVAAIFKEVAASVPIPSGPLPPGSAQGTGISAATLVVQNDRPDDPVAVAIKPSVPGPPPALPPSASPRVAPRLSAHERASLEKELAQLEKQRARASGAERSNLSFRIDEIKKTLLRGFHEPAPDQRAPHIFD